MIRRLAKPAAAVLLSMVAVTLTVPPVEFLEAISLSDLLQPGGSLTEGDKTFSNFTFSSTATLPPPAGTSLIVPTPSTIDVTASTGPGGVISLTFPLNMSASTAGTEGAFADVLIGFDVTVTGSSDVISGVTLTATGEPGGASVVALVTGVSDALVVNPPPNSVSAPISGLTTLEVDATANVGVVPDGPTSGEIDDVIFTFPQTTTSSPVPELGSLTLIFGGLGTLLARTLYRRRG
jgi:hypothetical protein